MAFVFAVCAVMIPIAGPFVEFFYSKKFASTAPLLVVLIWSEVPVFFGIVMNNAMVAKGVQRWLPVSTILGAVANVLLNLALIPTYGALGSSWATVISYSLAGVFFLLLFSDTRPLALPGLRISTPLLLVTVGITILLHVVSWPAWLKLTFAAFCYAGGAIATKSLVRADLQRVWHMVRSQSARF
jgi:O-antigen/teichoic acid export membrane protein